MNDRLDLRAGFEPERYELDEQPWRRFELDRREFLKISVGGILVLLVSDRLMAQESGGNRRRQGGRGMPDNLDAWLHVADDGVITVFTGKVEVGQNVRTSLSQAVAEELHVGVGSIQLVMADTQLTPFDAGTFGSRSTPDMGLQLRRVAAAAREILIDLASAVWKADRSLLSADDGKIVHATSGESLDFGSLAKGQKLTRSVSGEVPVAAAEQWTVCGQSVAKVDARALVTGKHVYSTDVQRPGLLHARVLRPDTQDGTLVSADTKEAQAIAGIMVVRDGDFIGVVAASEHAASKALKTIRAEWKSGPTVSSDELYDYLRNQTASAPGGRGGRGGGGGDSAGSVSEGLKQADVRLEQTYRIAYIAHAPLEPRAAVAEWTGQNLTVWTGTQRPFGVRGELAGAFGIPEENIRVIVPDTGSGYGGKHTGEAAVEAARLAKAAGKPVKLIWTREEEFTWAYFRPAGVIDIKSGATREGVLTAWECHNYNSGGSALETPYDCENRRSEFHSVQSPLRQGSYRALASTANVFARETNMDEIARELHLDPLEFRRKNLSDERLSAVLEAAAGAFGWGEKMAAGHGCGIACGTEKGSYVATCAEVLVESSSKEVQVIRAVSAFECGAIVNPNHLENQIEGAMVMGLGGALFEAIDFKGGKILNPRFAFYRVPRFGDVPEMEVVLLDRKDLPSTGAGETPIIGIAPAVGNAIFDACGVRLRSLPLAREGI